MTRSRPARVLSPPGSRTSTSAGVRSMSDRTATRARSSVRASRACAKANRKTTAAPSDHSTKRDGSHHRHEHQDIDVERPGEDDRQALGTVSGRPAARASANDDDVARVEGAQEPPRGDRNPSAVQKCLAEPDVFSSPGRQPRSGSSCSSQARMPVCATASAMRDVVSFAASYRMRSRCPTTSASSDSRPVESSSGGVRGSPHLFMAVHSLEFLLKIDSACSSQTGHSAIERSSWKKSLGVRPGRAFARPAVLLGFRSGAPAGVRCAS